MGRGLRHRSWASLDTRSTTQFRLYHRRKKLASTVFSCRCHRNNTRAANMRLQMVVMRGTPLCSCSHTYNNSTYMGRPDHTRCLLGDDIETALGRDARQGLDLTSGLLWCVLIQYDRQRTSRKPCCIFCWKTGNGN